MTNNAKTAKVDIIFTSFGLHYDFFLRETIYFLVNSLFVRAYPALVSIHRQFPMCLQGRIGSQS